MKKVVPEKIKALARALGSPLYVVGGATRDFLLEKFNIIPHAFSSKTPDWDICAPLSVELIEEKAKEVGFSVCGIFKNTGTLKLKSGNLDVEYASFRTDEYVRGHIPSSTQFTSDISLDAKRRDFKMNAIYYDVFSDKFVDVLGGIEDIKNRTISTTREPDRVFAEDGLRLLRLVRFACSLDMRIESETLAAAKAHSDLICEITKERIAAEMEKILVADTAYSIPHAQYEGLILLKQIGLLKYILPELDEGDKIEQRPDYHNYNVLMHSFRAVYYAPENIRLAALLHDVGKVKCNLENGNSYDHEHVGEEIAKEILERLKVNLKEHGKICRLIRYHMYDMLCNTGENKIKRLIVENYDIFFDLLALKQADYSACKDDTSPAPTVVRWEKIYEKMKEEGTPFTLRDLKINGKDLTEIGFEGKSIGDTLKLLFDECVLNPALNDRERLIKRATKILEKHN